MMTAWGQALVDHDLSRDVMMSLMGRVARIAEERVSASGPTEWQADLEEAIAAAEARRRERSL